MILKLIKNTGQKRSQESLAIRNKNLLIVNNTKREKNIFFRRKNLNHILKMMSLIQTIDDDIGIFHKEKNY